MFIVEVLYLFDVLWFYSVFVNINVIIIVIINVVDEWWLLFFYILFLVLFGLFVGYCVFAFMVTITTIVIVILHFNN